MDKETKLISEPLNPSPRGYIGMESIYTCILKRELVYRYGDIRHLKLNSDIYIYIDKQTKLFSEPLNPYPRGYIGMESIYTWILKREYVYRYRDIRHLKLNF